MNNPDSYINLNQKGQSSTTNKEGAVFSHRDPAAFRVPGNRTDGVLHSEDNKKLGSEPNIKEGHLNSISRQN